jgi:hypothetical protein
MPSSRPKRPGRAEERLARLGAPPNQAPIVEHSEELDKDSSDLTDIEATQVQKNINTLPVHPPRWYQPNPVFLGLHEFPKKPAGYSKQAWKSQCVKNALLCLGRHRVIHAHQPRSLKFIRQPDYHSIPLTQAYLESFRHHIRGSDPGPTVVLTQRGKAVTLVVKHTRFSDMSSGEYEECCHAVKLLWELGKLYNSPGNGPMLQGFMRCFGWRVPYEDVEQLGQYLCCICYQSIPY